MANSPPFTVDMQPALIDVYKGVPWKKFFADIKVKFFVRKKNTFFCQTASLLTFSFWFVVVNHLCFKLRSFSVASLVKNIMFAFSIITGCFETSKTRN